jgi:hypothetical protein
LSGQRTEQFVADAAATADVELRSGETTTMPRWLAELGTPGWVIAGCCLLWVVAIVIRCLRRLGDEVRELLLTIAGIFRGYVAVRDSWQELRQSSRGSTQDVIERADAPVGKLGRSPSALRFPHRPPTDGDS